MSLPIVSRNVVSRFRRGYRSRSLLVTPFFGRFGTEKSVLLTESRTHINRDRKFVYSRIPKAGNSTVIATLYKGRGDVGNRDYVEGIKKGDLSPSKLAREDVDEIERAYFIFTFIRNPFSRIISCYHDKVSRRSPFRELVSKFHFQERGKDISFDDFLDFLSEEKNLYLDAHWAPQVDLLPFPINRYDFFGSVEKMSDSLRSLMHRLELDGSHVDYRSHATGASSKVARITESQAEKMLRIYQADFSALGYSERLQNAMHPPEIAD